MQKNLRDPGDRPQVVRERLNQLVSAAEELAPAVGVVAACKAIGVSRATLYRRRRPAKKAKPRKNPDRALSDTERQAILDVLHCPQFMDKAPATVYATLLDEGIYLI